MRPQEFSQLRYGMFIHYGLYSQLGRGEWVMNREKLSRQEMLNLAQQFQPSRFDAEQLCQLAVEGGMKYLVFTTMHHEGFRLYQSSLSDFNSWHYCRRDLVREVVAGARKHGLRIGLYHSLNNWFDRPDAVDALEDPEAYRSFIEHCFARLRELLQQFSPIDIMWYDGWWPFNAEQWQAERMNQELRNIQSNLLFNGRNGLDGDFRTPEQHLGAPSPWAPWEACITLNQHWGYHAHDQEWKSPQEVIRMLLTCAQGQGNLLLNVGPDASGSVPEASQKIIRQVGDWLKRGGEEMMQDLEKMSFSHGPRQPGEHGDWDHAGSFYRKDKKMYWPLFHFPGQKATLSGLEMQVEQVSCGKFGSLEFSQQDDIIQVSLPEEMSSQLCPVLVFGCQQKPSIYRCGGMRQPKLQHPRYDPVEPDIKY